MSRFALQMYYGLHFQFRRALVTREKLCRLQPFSEDTLGGGNLRGPNIAVP
jgi:hypothetical protein